MLSTCAPVSLFLEMITTNASGLTEFLLDDQSYRYALIPLSTVGIFLSEGYAPLHYILLACNLNDHEAIVVDSLARPNNAEPNYIQFIEQTLTIALRRHVHPSYVTSIHCLGAQQDGYQCGIYMLEAARIFLQKLDFNQIHKIDIKQARKEWSTLLSSCCNDETQASNQTRQLDR